MKLTLQTILGVTLALFIQSPKANDLSYLLGKYHLLQQTGKYHSAPYRCHQDLEITEDSDSFIFHGLLSSAPRTENLPFAIKHLDKINEGSFIRSSFFLGRFIKAEMTLKNQALAMFARNCSYIEPCFLNEQHKVYEVIKIGNTLITRFFYQKRRVKKMFTCRYVEN